MRVRFLLMAVAALSLAGCGDAGSERAGDGGVVAEIDRQMAENQESLPQDEASLEPVPRRSLERFVREHQAVGFFAGEDAAAAARRIGRAYEREWGETAAVRTRLDELSLLAYDRDRVWFEDIERDVLPGNDEYVRTFRQWGRISGGAFAPNRIRERWHGEEGPVTIEFRLRGRRHRAQAAPQGDFLDLCVLTGPVNRAIRSSGRQFALYRPDAALGQSAFVVAVTPRERRALTRRGWRFATADEVRNAFGYGRLYEGGGPAPCA